MRSRKKHLIPVCSLALTALLFATVTSAFDGLPLNANGQVAADGHTSETSDFRQVGMGNGVAKDGAKATLNTYLASDGIKVFQAIIYYVSDDRTKSAFDVQAKLATKIIDQGPVLNGRSHVVEQRLAFEITDKYQQTSFQVMFTDGNRLIEIDSTSLADALRFEKEIVKIRDEVRARREKGLTSQARALASPM